MELAIVGAGSLGQAFATLLARSGRAVTLVATARGAAALGAVGAIRLEGAVTVESPVAPAPAPAGTVGVTADPRELSPGVGLLFMTKAHQLAAAAAAVAGAWPPGGAGPAWVGGVQNGLVAADVLGRAFGLERVVGAVTILGADRQGDGVIRVASLGATYLGELDGRRSARVDGAVRALGEAGIPTEAPADIRSALWSKACNSAGVFGISVPARVSALRLFGDADLLRAYLALVREAAAVAAAHGIPVGDYAGFPIRRYVSRPDDETVAALAGPAPGGSIGPAGGREFLPSMTQDLLRGRPLEVDEVFGDLVERAERAGVAVPRLRLVRDLIRGLDPGRHPT